VWVERQADEGERRDPLIIERLSQCDVGAEGPSAHEDGSDRLGADAPDRGRDVARLGPSAAVRPARAHDAAEVEAKDGEASGGELRADRPEDRMILAATVPGMRVAHDGSGHGRALRDAEVAFERD
jgi:hypothetical protein